MEVYDKLEALKIVPVVALEDVKDAVATAEALIGGGLPVAEITFRTAAAEGALREISAAHPEMLLGAGTVTTLQQAKCALAAGAKFLVTPGFSDELTAFAVGEGVPVFPGVCTPTEIMMTLKYQLPVLKFFPAGQYGGLAAIKALNGPFPELRFMPTGGIEPGNLKEYLSYPKVIACGGSWMVKKELIASGRFDEIRRLTAEAVDMTCN